MLLYRKKINLTSVEQELHARQHGKGFLYYFILFNLNNKHCNCTMLPMLKNPYLGIAIKGEKTWFSTIFIFYSFSFHFCVVKVKLLWSSLWLLVIVYNSSLSKGKVVWLGAICWTPSTDSILIEMDFEVFFSSKILLFHLFHKFYFVCEAPILTTTSCYIFLDCILISL